MFNLIVGSILDGSHGELDADRFLERTKPEDEPSKDLLQHLPTLVMPERDQDDGLARLGHVGELRKTGRSVYFRFTANGIPPLTIEDVWAARRALGIDDWDFTRTRWTLPSRDLYAVLAEEGLLGRQHQPTAFVLPSVRPKADRVAVMMPFQGFDPVWQALQRLGADDGLLMQRADSIWENAKVMDDIALLIAEAAVVICDLSGRNANVFYETGLAQMLGRPTILIAQSRDDIPFDLQAERNYVYEPTEVGLQSLRVTLSERLRTIRGSSRY